MLFGMINHLITINKHRHFSVQVFDTIIESNNLLKEDE
jgi:hypothetical protein